MSKVTLKSNTDEALSNETLMKHYSKWWFNIKKRNVDETLNAGEKLWQKSDEAFTAIEKLKKWSDKAFNTHEK